MSESLVSDDPPVSSSLSHSLEADQLPPAAPRVDGRTVYICALAAVLGLAGTVCAQALIWLIDAVTNLSFYGRFSGEFVSPADHHLGVWVIFVPIGGAIVVGLMARYGSAAIRGHGIPEVMEGVLTRQSVIPARVSLLKPVSAAIAIGTGGPFGAEGPIIASGGALGSLFGQILKTTDAERKTLLAAGAAAGMSATFGCPLASILLAVELLLFEYRVRSLVPVAFASATAAGLREVIVGSDPMFAMPLITAPTLPGQAMYILIGCLMGFVALVLTWSIYAVEDAFQRTPIHWMWWPAIGAVAVGVIGYFQPHTFGVGYENISNALSAKLAMGPVLILCVAKFVSWAISLGSGTSGGTLAPLFTIGGGLGLVLGTVIGNAFPDSQVDIHVAALVGMAAVFAGASRALLASVVFAAETTHQPMSLLPLLGGCAAAYLVCAIFSRESIMTERMARRGIRVPTEYLPDALDSIYVRDIASRDVITLKAEDTLLEVRVWLTSDDPAARHQGFPLIDKNGSIVGVLTRRILMDPSISPLSVLEKLVKRPPYVVYEDCTVREALEHMLNHKIGRLPVIARDGSAQLIGIVTRRDILAAYSREPRDANTARRIIHRDTFRQSLSAAGRRNRATERKTESDAR